MIFANVTDIRIPQGNVIKIHETNGGRVLWEKKSIAISPFWEVIDGQVADSDTQPLHVAKWFYPNDSERVYAGGVSHTKLVNGQGTLVDRHEWGPYGYVYSREKRYGTEGYPNTLFVKKVLAITDELDHSKPTGMIYFLDGDTSYYYFYRGPKLYQTVSSTDSYALKTVSPISETSVHITHSPERQEYLVTGLSGNKSCVLPADFNSSTSITYQTGRPASKFINTSWSKELSMYYGANGSDKKVYYSNDGISWAEVTAADKGNVFDVFFLSMQRKLCAISSNQVSISDDGVNWSHFDTPFSEAFVAAYSDDTGYLCVFDKTKAYVTNDFRNWSEAELPGGRSINWIDVIYLDKGVFIGTTEVTKTITPSSYTPREFYKLSLSVPYSVYADERFVIDSSE